MIKLTERQDTLLNELVEDFKGNTEVVRGRDGRMNPLRKRVVEALLDGEMTRHLGDASHAPAGNSRGNSRNGHAAKKVQSKDGERALEIPRDRNGRFEPRVLFEGATPYGRHGRDDDCLVRQGSEYSRSPGGVGGAVRGGGFADPDIQRHPPRTGREIGRADAGPEPGRPDALL